MTLDEKIELLEAAKLNLALGKTVTVFVDQNGERTEFKAGSLKAINEQLKEYKYEKALATGSASPYAAPIRYIY